MDSLPRGRVEPLSEVVLPYRFHHPETQECLSTLLADRDISRHLTFLREHHRDSYTHCLRVGALSLDLALDRTDDPEELRIIGAGGLLHDLGKCDIAEELLSGASALSPDERLAMQAHTRTGFDRLSDDPTFDGIRNIVVAHHELKRHPYPRTGLERRTSERGDEDRREDDGLVKARTAIVAAADMLDALSCARSYKAALPKDQVERILREQFTGEVWLIDEVLCRM